MRVHSGFLTSDYYLCTKYGVVDSLTYKTVMADTAYTALLTIALKSLKVLL